ncbi:condensin-2 complex subunit D3 [Eublepharis macularius]|uniref:Condensin-2 complex subunit D3 n=1 Tax=Eublepharis macularius TaxID=481883 RepID=A0AA97LFG4_EUBMA|nr:condensin-2 complex subunit D3 [Eublepharis macularius]
MAAERLLDAVERWRVRDVSSAWVDTVWELDFTETEPLDSRQESVITEDGVDSFSQLYEALSPFATDDQGTAESAWALFAENNVSHNAIVAVLYHFVQEGQKKKADVAQRLYALHSAGLYFLLVEIPGSVANQLFHPVMFEKCLQTFQKCWPQGMDLPRKRKKGQTQNSQTSTNKRGRVARKRNSQMDDIFEEEEEQEEELFFSASDLLQIREALFLLLKNFLRLLSKFSLKEKPQCVQTCIQIFVDFSSFEPCSSSTEASENMTLDRAKYIPELASLGLRLMCSPLHGLEDKALHWVFHQLLYVILMLTRREGSGSAPAAIPAQAVSARNQAIKFISSLTEELTEVAFPVLRILLQHICVKVPDKSEYRAHAALALSQLLHQLPCAQHADFIAWLYRYSCNNKISYRVFALDVALALLEFPEREPGDTLSEEQQAFLKHKFLVQVMVFGRCSDKASTVRSKALSSFAQCLERNTTSNVESIVELLQSTSGSTALTTHGPMGASLSNTEGPSRRQKTFPTFKTIEVSNERDNADVDGKEVMAMLRQRAEDEKTNVRKSALQVLMNILKHDVIPCTPEDLATLQDRCRDPAVSVRKQALQSITDLLMSHPDDVLIQKAWLTGVIPVIMDCESSVQEKALACLDQLLLQPIKHSRHPMSGQTLAWDLLTLLTKESQELSRYLSKAFHVWSKQGRFSSTFVNAVISHVCTERASPAWMLLAKVAGSTPKLDYSKVIDTWDEISRQPAADLDTTVHVLSVIGSIAKHLSRSVQHRLIDDIKSWLQDFQCPLEVISPAVETLQKLCHASSDALEEAQELLDEICGGLVSACKNFISSVVLKEGGAEQLQEDILVRHLFTLGEAAQLCPAKVEKRIFLLIQSILASPMALDQPSSPGDSDDLSATPPLSQFRGSVMPPVVRAHAFITLGKLCLQHEDLAKQCIAALARELEVSKDMAIRNNVVIVICDLCIRYTIMVDKYVPNVSTCLKDPEPFIRKQTLILLTNLLQEEFVKWKGSLFFRFVSVLVDPDSDIASLAEFCLVHLLLKKNPVMFSQHFIECIFHFNSYERHEKYNRFSQSEREKKLFSLKGQDNKGKRMQIYKFLLDHFTDEQRFNITSKISHNVLACFVDGVLPLDMEASELLSDTFEILSCKEIKLSAMRARPEEDLQPEEDEMAMANVVMQVAQKKLISQVQKKNFIEHIMPIITSLKTLLEQSRLPALRDLMNYLREVMQDYRNEIKELFAVDKQLAAELEYDMKKYEEQLQREMEQSQELIVQSESLPALAAAQRSPSSERAALPGNQPDATSPTARRDSSPLRAALPPSSVGFVTPPARNLKPQTRRMSLNTFAILNSAKKAMEAAGKQRSRSVGGRLITPGSQQSSKQATSISLSQPSSEATVLPGRAISTPDKSINNVTFGAGVSYISLTNTPSSAQEKRTQDQEKDVVCLAAPDKPSSQPQQWKVNSPRKKSCTPRIGLRKRSSKTPLKPAN